MEIAIHYIFCFKCMTNTIGAIFGVTPPSRSERENDDASDHLRYTPSDPPSDELDLPLATKSRIINPMHLKRAILKKRSRSYFTLEIEINPDLDCGAETLNQTLNNSKQVARDIIDSLASLHESIVYEKTLQSYLDPDRGSIHDNYTVLLTTFSETAVIQDSHIGECEYRSIKSYCGANSQGCYSNNEKLITGLSSNAFINVEPNLVREYISKVSDVTADVACIDYIRMWARDAAEELLYRNKGYQDKATAVLSDTLLRSRFDLQDSVPENHLASGLEGDVYHRIWGAWSGQSLLSQAESRCDELSRIIDNIKQVDEKRWENRISFAAFGIAVLGLLGLFTDLYDFLSRGDIVFRVEVFVLYCLCVLLGARLIMRHLK